MADLLSLIQKEIATVSQVKLVAEELSRKLSVEFDDLDQCSKSNAMLPQIEHQLYLLDYMLDECLLDFSPLGGLTSFKPKCFTSHRRHNVGSRLKEIRSRFPKLVGEFEQKNARDAMEIRAMLRELTGRTKQISSTFEEPQIYGRNDDKRKVVDFLCIQACGSFFLSIYPIVGLDGVGKTTLAQSIYNDERVSSHFNVRIWVFASENFSAYMTLHSILESITREKHGFVYLDSMTGKVREMLQRKRYLLVLDGIRMTGDLESEWKMLKSVLSCGYKGSCILVTTSTTDVARIMGTCQAHHLSPLSYNDCWILFKQHAFGPNEEGPAELVKIGEKIVEKCGGLPRAVQALGSLLRTQSAEREWLEVMESGKLFGLRLRYFGLPPTLKQCFSFCAIFPKDKEIVKEDLIHLWMANGFLSSRLNSDVAYDGEETWDELYRMSFFQDIKTNDSGDISFKINGLIHDLALSVMEGECVILEITNMTHLATKTHHIGFVHGLFSFNKEDFQKVESLRTLYQIEFRHGNTESSYFPINRSLRVLSTSSLNLLLLGNLMHLRYLELHGFDIKIFPDSIYGLQKLEILKLKNFPELSCLPKRLTCLQNLRHLVIEGCSSLSSLFPNVGKLSRLRSLSVFFVSLEKGHELAELRDLQLGGKLCIEGLQNVGSKDEAEKANLKDKKDLRELCLSWENRGKTKSHDTLAQQIIEGLQPHSNLKSLRIYDYEGSSFPSWMDVLSNLVALELINCQNCQQLPPLGKLPCLRKLEVYDMENVKYIDSDESYSGVAFPSLEELEARGLPNLERLLKIEQEEIFPCLSNLVIHDCYKLQLPNLPSVTHLKVCGCSDELLAPISSFRSLTFLHISGCKDLTSLPEGMLKNLTGLKTLLIHDFPKLKKLPYDLFNLKALEVLEICSCGVLESLPEQAWKGLHRLQTLEIAYCGRLRSLPEGFQQLVSLKVLKIEHCPALRMGFVEGTGENWHKKPKNTILHLFP